MLRFSLLFLLALQALRADFSCPAGFSNANGYCYAVFNRMLTHDQAESTCASYGAKLATINDPLVNAVIANSSQDLDTLWLGYKCTSSYQCTGDDGSIISTSQYFYGGVANPIVGKCVVMETGGGLAGKWLSLDCSQASPFVCGLSGSTGPQTVNAIQASKCGVPYKLRVPANITSMNYPSNYDNDENCSYFIYSTAPFTIYFDDFWTEAGADVVVVTASNSPYFGTTSYVGQYSGALAPFSVYVSANNALVTFVTNNNYSFRGFTARIQ